VITRRDLGPGPLLEALRRSGRVSVMRGCDDRTCGACRVLVDGELVLACAGDVPEDAAIEAYEDLAEDPIAERAVSIFDLERTTRCKQCVGGVAVAAVYIDRSGADVDAIAAGARCACTGRGSLRRALEKPKPDP
jgi:aerobic-type carbon monoxide dehydrogenase small subunit (CoxS/CutS family)